MIIYECGPIFEDFSVRMNADEKLNLLESEINFLMESINSDSIISESFILEDKNIFKTIGIKILAGLQKILDAIAILIDKIGSFIRDKVKAFKQKNLISKLKKGKLTKDQTDKITEKLNKMKLVDPKELTSLLDKLNNKEWELEVKNFNDVSLEQLEALSKVDDELWSTLMKIDLESYGREKGETLNQLGIDADLAKKLFVKFDAQQLVDNFQNIYNSTTSETENLKLEVEDLKKDCESLKNTIKNYKPENEIDKVAMSGMKITFKHAKIRYQAYNKAYIKLTKQEAFLESLALYLLKQDSGEKSDNGVEKVSGEVVDNDGNPV